MKKKVLRITGLLLAVYLVIFGARAAYTVSGISGKTQSDLAAGGGTQVLANNSIPRVVENYASTKSVISSSETSKTIVVDQKYEKVAHLSSKTDKFDEDIGKIKELIKAQKALTQQENYSGVQGERTLVLMIGVHPDKFDTLVEQLKNVGEQQSFNVVKTDKTGDYKNLMAKLATQRKYIASLRSLKEKGGTIQEMMELEAKILEVEEILQGYDVQLGSFSAENELCTVNLTLFEKRHSENIYTLGKVSGALFDAAAWSLWMYIGILFIIGLCAACALLIVTVISKIKGLNSGSVNKSEK